jgi:hypothetical protein
MRRERRWPARKSTSCRARRWQAACDGSRRVQPRLGPIVAAITSALACPGPAIADHRDLGADTIAGIGMGPAASVGGALGGRFTSRGASGRIRLGGRVARLGFELDTSVVALAGDDLDRAGMVLAVPTIGWYPVAHPHVQLALRGGLGYGVLSGERARPAPPCLEAPCAGPSTETIDHRGYGLELGATGAVHLGRRHGGRAILWADVGVTFVRLQMGDAVVAGKVVVLTFGIGHGRAM